MVSDVVSNVQFTSVFNYLLFAFFRVLVGNQDQEDKEDQRYYDTLIYLFSSQFFKAIQTVSSSEAVEHNWPKYLLFVYECCQRQTSSNQSEKNL